MTSAFLTSHQLVPLHDQHHIALPAPGRHRQRRLSLGLAAQTLDGRPLQFALIDADGAVIEYGDSVADAVWRMSVLAHEQYLQGMGHLRVHTSAPDMDRAAVVRPRI